MVDSIFQLFLTFGLGSIVSLLILLWARRLRIADENFVTSTDNIKPNNKLFKPISKTKSNKKEVKQKNVSVAKQKHIIEQPHVLAAKNQEIAKNLPESASANKLEKNRTESATAEEWIKVSKPIKKIKKTQSEIDNSKLEEKTVDIKEITKSNEIPGVSKQKNELNQDKDVLNKDAVTKKESVKTKEQEKNVKSKKLLIEEEKPNLESVKTKEQGKNVKSKKFLIEEEKPKEKTEVKEIISQEIKSETMKTAAPNADNHLKQKIDEMMTVLDKMKKNQKEESKSNNQMEKELELLKQKLKNQESAKEKLMEDLKKKTQAVTDLKNQFLIIQSELTKNIVANQAMSREKNKLETNAQKLEEQLSSIKEKYKHFDQLKNENEDLTKNAIELKQQLDHVKRDCNEILKTQETSLSIQITNLQSDKQRMQDQLLRVQSDLIEKNNKIQSYQQDLLTEKNKSTDQLTENLRMQKYCADLEQSMLLFKDHKSRHLNEAKRYEEQRDRLEKQIYELNTMKKELSEQNSALRQELDQLKHSQKMASQVEISTLNEKILLLQEQVFRAQNDLSVCQINSDELKATIDIQTQQITEIATEKENLLLLLDQYTTSLESAEKKLLSLQKSDIDQGNKWKESLMKSEIDAEKKILSLQEQAMLSQNELSAYKLNNDNQQVRIEAQCQQIRDLTAEKDNLILLVDQYKINLESAEKNLSNLQKSDNYIENKLKETLMKSEIDAEKKILSLQEQVKVSQNELTACKVGNNEQQAMINVQYQQIKELTAERDNHLLLIDQYKTGLKSTELILSKLQKSVDDEENKWRESLIKSETEAEKSKKELESVHNELMRIRNSRPGKNDLNFAYHCVDRSLSSLIDEMEARMVHFEKSFEVVVQERDNALAQLSSQLNGVSDNHNNICDEKSCSINKLELEKIKTDLSETLELNKTLENRCNKYKSLLDVGKDSLQLEQNRVRELQDKLTSLQSPSLDGLNDNNELPLN